MSQMLFFWSLDEFHLPEQLPFNCHYKNHFSLLGMAALDSKASGKMGMRAVIYYMTTTFIAVFIGIIVVLIIHPGKGSKDEFGKQQTIEQVSPADAFLDLIR